MQFAFATQVCVFMEHSFWSKKNINGLLEKMNGYQNREFYYLAVEQLRIQNCKRKRYLYMWNARDNQHKNQLNIRMNVSNLFMS